MRWLMRALGLARAQEPPPHIQQALDTGVAAGEAIAAAHDAADSYWQTRRDNARTAEQRVIEDYRLAESRRRRQ